MAAYFQSVLNGKWKTAVLILVSLSNVYGTEETEDEITTSPTDYLTEDNTSGEPTTDFMSTTLPSETSNECGTVTSPEVLNRDGDIALSIGRRVGRQNVVRGSAPWMARLYVRGRGHICGGSLIDRQWVITAAHCFHDGDPVAKDDLSIRLGDHDEMETETSEILIPVKEIYEHEGFDLFTFDNDIALLKLVNRTVFSDYIRPICVADKVKNRGLMTVGTIGRVNGWGRIVEFGLTSRFLTKINIPLVSFPTCKRHFRKRLTTFTRNMFCAGHYRGGSDACQGDSGGPYSVQDHTGRWYLTGIVSWGEGCGRRRQYGVYTRYSKYHEWIQNTMERSKMKEYFEQQVS